MSQLKKFSRQTFSSLKVRNYRLYFIGQAISLCGTWMQMVGQAWLVLKLTGSGGQLGLVIAAQFLPVLVFGAAGGVLVDRFSKRALLYFTQTAFGILALVLGLLVLTNIAQIWMVYTLAVLFGFITLIDSPTRQTFVMEMVGKDQLPNAVSLNATQFNMARVVGPAIAGALIAGFGLAACFLVNAVSYIAVLMVLFMMRQREFFSAPLVARAKGQLREGFAYVKKTPLVRDTLILIAIIGTLAYEFSVSLPILAQFTFHGSVGSYAALTGAIGVGAIFGGLYTASRKKVTQAMLAVSAALFGSVILISAVMPSLALAVAGLLLVGFFSVNFTSLANVILQFESRPDMRGRVMALWYVAFLGSTPIGGPIIGFVGQYFGPRWSLGVGGLAALVAAAIYMRSIKKYPKNFSDAESPVIA